MRSSHVKRGISPELGLNAFLSASRKCWGSLFHNENGIYSIDDDKQKAQSLKAQHEGFVRKENITHILYITC